VEIEHLLHYSLYLAHRITKRKEQLIEKNDWANEWQLKLNADKCCRITYTASNSNLCHTKYYIDNGNMRRL